MDPKINKNIENYLDREGITLLDQTGFEEGTDPEKIKTYNELLESMRSGRAGDIRSFYNFFFREGFDIRQDSTNRYETHNLLYTLQGAFHAFDNAKRVTDVGCGSGLKTVYYSTLGIPVFAFDLSGEGIESLKKRHKNYEDSAAPLECSVGSLDLVCGKSDVVLATKVFGFTHETMQQSEETEYLLRRLAEKAEINGRIFLAINTALPQEGADFYSMMMGRTGFSDVDAAVIGFNILKGGNLYDSSFLMLWGSRKD